MPKKPKQAEPSPVVRLLECVWGDAQAATSHSWERLNGAMRAALELAVGAGFEFAADDFRSLSRFRSGYWMGESGEWVYSLAVREGNDSAAKAFEEWMGREPIIADKVDPAGFYSRTFAHKAGERDRERLHVGCYFPWKGRKVKVTSFTDGGAAVAVAYKPAEGKYDHERKVAKRFTITREDVIADRAERKERVDLMRKMTAAANAGRAKSGDILAKLGVKSQKEYDALPLKAIRKVATEVLAA